MRRLTTIIPGSWNQGLAGYQSPGCSPGKRCGESTGKEPLGNTD